jgi:hypothetical protein
MASDKKQRIQIKVFDVESGQEVSSHEHVMSVANVGVGGYCWCCTCTHPGCIMAALPPSTT